MKKSWKPVIFMVLIILLSALLIQCSSDKQEQSQDSFTEKAAEDSGEQSMVEEETSDGQKVVTNVYISMETTSFDSSAQKLEDLVEKHGGYIENSSVGYNNYMGNDVFKSGVYTARIPEEKESEFRTEAEGLGNIVSENTSNSDITKEYADTESKLRLLEVKEERILAIMEEATEMEDIIALEDSLNEVIYEKEQLKNQISRMDNQVSYSTVEVQLLEVSRYSTGETPDTGFWQKLSDAFKNSIYVFGVVVEKLIVFLIYSLPFAAMGLAIYMVSRKIYRKFKKK